MVHISVAPSDRAKADAFLEKFSADIYERDDPHATVLMMTADNASRILPTPYSLCPATKVYANAMSFLFSGSISDCDSQVGITVAHATGPGSIVSLDPEGKIVIGQCTKTFRRVVDSKGAIVTADLAVLKLRPKETIAISNVIEWPYRRQLNIKLYRGDIPIDTKVIIKDKDRLIQHGLIKRTKINDKKCRLNGGICECGPSVHNVGIFNMIGICSWLDNNTPATAEGDSGALVMSTPRADSDDVDVYGFVVGLLEEDGENKIKMTIANSLQHVIPEIASIGGSETDGVDFYSPDPNSMDVDD